MISMQVGDVVIVWPSSRDAVCWPARVVEFDQDPDLGVSPVVIDEHGQRWRVGFGSCTLAHQRLFNSPHFIHEQGVC